MNKSLIYFLITIIVLTSHQNGATMDHKEPHITIKSDQALIDQPVEIIISDLKPHEQIKIQAQCKNVDHNLWQSEALFEADDQGVINVAKQAPISGSYQKIDPMGLFWTMTPLNKGMGTFFLGKSDILSIQFSVFSHNTLIAQKNIERLLMKPDITRNPINEKGVVGTLFYSQHQLKRPGIIIVPGSNGGIPEKTAQLLASHGYTALALGYFAAEGLPEKCENIPLEYFKNAIEWFKKQPYVDTCIALLGSSLGGQLVLLLGATFPREIDTIIANVPSSIVYWSFDENGNPAWIYKNKPVPFLEHSQELFTLIKNESSFEKPLTYTPLLLTTLNNDRYKTEQATIPVEKIVCPLLLISGEDDVMWPSPLFANRIMQRLDEKKSSIKREHLMFKNAGHCIQFPYLPSLNAPIYNEHYQIWEAFGGTMEGNARANEESWQAVLAFLKETIG